MSHTKLPTQLAENYSHSHVFIDYDNKKFPTELAKLFSG